jgi:hypothetical protein
MEEEQGVVLDMEALAAEKMLSDINPLKNSCGNLEERRTMWRSR